MNSIDKTAVFWTIGIVAIGVGFASYGINDPSQFETPKTSVLSEKDVSVLQEIDSAKLVSDMSIMPLNNNDRFELVASKITKKIGSDSFEMLGYNQQSPGPVLLVTQGDEISVDFKNDLDFPTTVHWHGLRLDYTSDGVPGMTQEPVMPDETFEYELKFPDSGMFLYHPHIRNEMQMELGLYGNILVESEKTIPATIQVPLILDDILLTSDGIEEFDPNFATHTLMGRFGNTLMINGNVDYSLEVNQGDIVRFYLTNTANTRVFDFGIEQHKLKLVGDDASNYEKETLVDSVMMASLERRIVDVLFDDMGNYEITHTTPDKQYVLGEISVIPSNSKSNFDFNPVEDKDVINEIKEFRKYFDVAPDLELEFDINTSLIHTMNSDDGTTMSMQDHTNEMQSMEHEPSMNMDNVHEIPLIEWEDKMPKMNIMSNEKNTQWILRDMVTGQEGFDIVYDANVGDVKKIRLFNNPDSAHPMQHPIHLHGQRFLVLSEDGIPNDNLAWKDTVLVPAGKTVDILVEFSNPGKWAMHCHILEHAESGMITEINVT